MRLKMVSLFFFFALLLALSTYAQEPVEPLPTEVIPTAPPATETPTPTATALPTATETLLLTATDTLPPTSTDTSLPTATSSILTETASTIPEVTHTPTAASTSSPSPPGELTLWYSNDFDQPYAPDWMWGDILLRLRLDGWAFYLSRDALVTYVPVPDLFDVRLQTRFLLEGGHLRIRLRESSMGSYSLTVNTNGQVNFYRNNVRTETEQAPYPAPFNHWSLQGRIEGGGRGTIYFWTNTGSEPFLYDLTNYLRTLYPDSTQYLGPNCDNLAADVDISQAWWNSPDRIAECIVIGGLDDA